MNTPTVLIVEDDESIRELYVTAFTAAGLQTITATTGNEAVTQALKHHPEAILMDIIMPVMNGHEAAAKIRLDSWGKKAVIVYLTNMTDAENVVHAVEHGGEEYIVKANTTPKEVVNRVRMAMRA
jgi:DNA-binding response OmpR family regulator